MAQRGADQFGGGPRAVRRRPARHALPLAARGPADATAMLSMPPSGEVSSSLSFLSGRCATPRGDLQRQQQWADGRVGGQRDLVAGHLDRYAGRDECSGERWESWSARPAPARPSRSRPDRPADARCAGCSAMCSASAPALLQVKTSTRPLGSPGSAVGCRKASKTSAGSERGRPRRVTTLRLAASNAAAEAAGPIQRDARVQERRRQSGTAPGNPRCPRASAPRKA